VLRNWLWLYPCGLYAPATDPGVLYAPQFTVHYLFELIIFHPGGYYASLVVNFSYDGIMPRPPKPGGAVFMPRSFSPTDHKFGRTSTDLTEGPVESPQHVAAELQHSLTNYIREHLLDSHSDLKKFCEQRPLPTGLTYERLQRIGRGETMLTLTDLMFWIDEIPGLTEFLARRIQQLGERPRARSALSDGDHGVLN
jgi:hypothetical protein